MIADGALARELHPRGQEMATLIRAILKITYYLTVRTSLGAVLALGALYALRFIRF